MPECITLLGTVSIQDYIFRSNRLRENAGASYIVASALEDWKKSHPKNVIYVGGGNAALRFPGTAAAIKAVSAWSRDILEKFPGLRMVAAHEEVENGDYERALKQARNQLFQRENALPAGWELGSLCVVRECASTALAASEYDQRSGTWLSQEAAAKTQAVLDANRILHERYRTALKDKYAFPLDIENLGTAKGASQAAIVHADGNDFGKLIDKCASGLKGGPYLERIQEISEAITRLGRLAFQDVIAELAERLSAIPPIEGVRPAKVKPEECRYADNAQFYFPGRPIVDGGDDLTFVCHGRLGLRLAASYLRKFEQRSAQMQEFPGRLSACAGVLIMPGKFPFARGYKLVEEITASAKRARRHATGDSAVSWIDYQLILEGAAGSLDAIREPYARGTEVLPQRPYFLPNKDVPPDLVSRSWGEFERRLNMLRKWPRNRAKRLMEAIARGQGETLRISKQFQARGYNIDPWERDVIADSLWNRPECRVNPLFDPLEVLDFHIPEAE